MASSLQKLNLAARKNKLGIKKTSDDSETKAEQESTVSTLKKAAEYQLAYVVLGYKASIEKL